MTDVIRVIEGASVVPVSIPAMGAQGPTGNTSPETLQARADAVAAAEATAADRQAVEAAATTVSGQAAAAASAASNAAAAATQAAGDSIASAASAGTASTAAATATTAADGAAVSAAAAAAAVEGAQAALEAVQWLPTDGSGHNVGLNFSLNLGMLDAARIASVAHTGTVNVPRSDGVFAVAGQDALPRSDLGLLIEPSGANAVPAGQSEGVSIFSTGSNATNIASSRMGPKGTSDYFTTVTSTGASGYRQRNFTVPADALTRTVSLDFVKASGNQIAALLMGHSVGAQGFARLNLTTGALVEISAGFYGSPASPVQDLGDRWRLSVKAANSGGTTLYVEAFPVVGGTGSVDVGGLMIETGPFMSSYVAGGATRGAVTVLSGADVGGAEGRVFVSAVAPLGVGSANQVLWQRDDGTANNRLLIYRDSSRRLHFKAISGGVTQSDRALKTVADGEALTVDMAWDSVAGVASYSLSGSAPFVEFGVSIPALAFDRLGCSTAGEQWGGRIVSYGAFLASGIAMPGFGDSFNRADTSPGSLGAAPDGEPYALYGAYAGSWPLPADTHGQIVGKTFLTDVPAVTYACKLSAETVHHIGCIFSIIPNASWNSGLATGASGIAILISAADDVGRLIEDIGPHIGLSRASGGLRIQTRRLVADGGNFITRALIPPANVGIVADGRLMFCDVEIFPNDDLVVTVNGIANTVNVPGLYAYPGKKLCWEVYETANPNERSRIHAAYSRDLIAP